MSGDVYRSRKLIVSQEEELKDAILLVFANKQDQKGALKAAQVRKIMLCTTAVVIL